MTEFQVGTDTPSLQNPRQNCGASLDLDPLLEFFSSLSVLDQMGPLRHAKQISQPGALSSLHLRNPFHLAALHGLHPGARTKPVCHRLRIKPQVSKRRPLQRSPSLQWKHVPCWAWQVHTVSPSTLEAEASRSL